MTSPTPASVEFTAPPMLPEQDHTPEQPVTAPRQRTRRSAEDQRKDRAHARLGRTLERKLRDAGIVPGMVAPTRDRRGHIRLTFRDVEQLLQAAEGAK